MYKHTSNVIAFKQSALTYLQYLCRRPPFFDPVYSFGKGMPRSREALRGVLTSVRQLEALPPWYIAEDFPPLRVRLEVCMFETLNEHFGTMK